MDQTVFSLLVGFLVGSHVGAWALHLASGWSLWITYPVGGLLGLVLLTVATFLFIEWLGRHQERNGQER